MSSIARWVRRLRRPAPPARTRPPLRPGLEPLEERRLPTAYTVTTTRDVLGDVTPGQVTLRDVLTAINTQARSGNAAAGTTSNTVAFAIGAVGSTQTITLASALPAVKHQLSLDGWSQGGLGYTGAPLIVLNGAAVARSANGLTLIAGSGNSTVRGLALEQFGSEGIELRGTSGNLLAGDWIGTTTAGTARLGSNTGGILLDQGAAGNTVGGTAAGFANVIAANGPGVEIKDAGSSGNVVLGNTIGADKNGTAYLGALAGVEIRAGAAGNTVGGAAAGSANVIAANGPGVEIKDPGTSGNVVLGNMIGANKSGTAYLGTSVGVEVRSQATGNIVGGASPGSGNDILANGPGVEIKDTGTSGNVVLGNLIGTDHTGSRYLGALAGVEIRAGTTGNTIGGTSAGAGNVIAANGPGVEIKDAGTSGNVLLGNLIGTDATGTAKVGTLVGVEVRAQATRNTIGGTAAGSGNVISGSLGPGVEVKDAGTSGNVLLGNFIGTDKSGTAKVGNVVGVEVRAGARGNTVGGTASGAANVISGNGLGVEIKDGGTSGNVVLGNMIGTDVSGTAALGNTGDGVLLRAGAASNTVGGTAAGSGNAIAFNAKGVVLIDAATVGDSILGNGIYGNAGPGIDLGNDGPTANGANPRALPNRGQNTPIITVLAPDSISVTLTSVPKTTFRVEFFATPSGGTANQGQTFLGFLDVTTNASGHVTMTATVATIPIGSVVTAAATNLTTGDTSEFSPG